VIVVTAGVHHADVLTLPLRADATSEGEIYLLGNRECVHIGAKSNHRTRTPSAQNADDSGASDSGLHFKPERAKVLGHERGGAMLFEAEFWMLVDVTPPGDDFWHHGGEALLHEAHQF
jgi:hypothetical protein